MTAIVTFKTDKELVVAADRLLRHEDGERGEARKIHQRGSQFFALTIPHKRASFATWEIEMASDEIYRRAGGRRAYNYRSRLKRECRIKLLFHLIERESDTTP